MKRLAVVVSLFFGCGSVEGKKPDAAVPRDTANQPDTHSIDAPAPPRCDPNKPFGAPTPVSELNTTSQEYTPWLTADELQVWFASERAGGQGISDIYMASRASKTDPFGAPALVAGVNSTGNDQRPTLTADGLNMYIEHKPAAGTYRITVATRLSTSDPFGTPMPVAALDPGLAQFILPDHSAIYFTSGRSGTNSIWRSARVSGVFQAPTLVDGTDLNTGGVDYPVPTPDELRLYLPSARTGTLGGNDVWMATRTSTIQGFNTPVNLGAPVNTAGAEVPSWVSADNCVMYLYRVNPTTFDIFVANRPQ